MKAANFLLFSDWWDDNGYLIMCAPESASWFEDDPYHFVGTTKGSTETKHLKEVQKVLPGFKFSKSSKIAGKCKVVLDTGFHGEIIDALTEERSSRPKRGDRVNFITGHKVTKAMRAEAQAEAQREADSFTERTKHEGIRRLLEYLNGLPSNAFTTMVKKHMDDARAHVPTLTTHLPADKRKEVNEIYLRTLTAIENSPKPLYFASKGEARVYQLGDALGTLHKDLRRILMRGYFDYDLKNCQFAINSVLWGVPNVEDYLRSGGSIWDALIPHTFPAISDDLLPSAKKVLKHLAYGYLYGMGHKKGQKISMQEVEDSPELYDVIGEAGKKKLLKQFKSHPFMKEMIDARDRRMGEVISEGGGLTAFGEFLEYEPSEKPSPYYADQGNARTILALISQSHETSLLLPVYEYIKEEGNRVTSPPRLALSQHDGFTVSKRLKLDSINRLLGDRFPTTLECEAL